MIEEEHFVHNVSDARPAKDERVDWLHRIWPDLPTTKEGRRQTGLDLLSRTFRATTVTTLAYLATIWLFPNRVDMTGALSALLTIQGTVSGSVRTGVFRSIAVILGVTLAIGFSAVFGLHWYSLFLAVFAGMLLAPIVRLRDMSIEIAISAMLILGTTSSGVAAENRVVATLIGSAVGVIFPLIFPPRVPVRQAATRVGDVGRRLESVMLGGAKQLRSGSLTMQDADHWLEATRNVNGPIETARDSIQQVIDLRRYNMTIWRHADVAPLLNSGLRTLDDCAFAVRALWTVIRRESPDSGASAIGDEDVVGAFGYVLEELGAAIGRYGDLIQAQALGRIEEAQERFENAVDSSLEAHAMLSELMLISGINEDGRHDLGAKDVLLRSSVLSAIEQILTELNIQTRLAEFDTWRASQLGYELPEGAIGPRIRTPWGRAAQRRLRQRAQEFEKRKTITVHDLSEETTQTLPAIRLDDKSQWPAARRESSSDEPRRKP